MDEVTKEILDNDPDSGDSADAQEARLNGDQLTGPVDAPWIVDEINTANGVNYQVSHFWDEITDEVCQVCMDYGERRSLDTANLIAAAPDLLEQLEAVKKLYYESIDGSFANRNFICRINMVSLEAAIEKAKGRGAGSGQGEEA